MKTGFRWNRHNVAHIGEHGISPRSAEHVIRHARRPFPRAIGDEKFLVWGADSDGSYLQVIFIYDPPNVIYVIHARPLNDSEKRRYRRQRR